MPLGRLASGSWSQLSTPTLDKTRPLLADKRESINARGQKSTPRDKECAGLIWFTALSFWLLLLVPVVDTDSADGYFGDYYAEEESPRFSEFNPVAKIIFTAIVVALLGVIAFEGFQLFRGPTASESATQQQEDDNEHLDINTLKGDPNDGDE